jgi:hypothetical protein
MTKALKDWTNDIAGLAAMDIDGVTNLYSEMLATAHDLGYKVPDELLIETEDPEQLKVVISPLHEGIKTFHAAKIAKDKEKKAAAKADARTTKKSVAKKPAKTAAQKDVSKETNMATATANKAAPAKKAAKAAKKAGKKAGKKAATANARKAAGGGATRFEGTEVISVKFKDVPGRAGSAVHDRLSNLAKFNGKTVDAFLKSSLGKSSTLHKAKAKGWITLK